ncbi:MAG: peptidylprolyl isomerase [Oscillospiraceae bacterium]|nr:peptidylprolyl isomerase [Oscillospiraceae bacterium]
MKRTVGLILCAIMLIMAPVSCANTVEEPLTPPSDSEQNGDSNAANDTHTESANDAAFSSFPQGAEGEPLDSLGDPEQKGSYEKADEKPADIYPEVVFSTEDVYEVAFASFPPDTVMLRAGGYDVTWAEIFVYMHSIVGTLSEYYGEEPVNWSAPWDDEFSCAEWVLHYAKLEALYMKAIEYGARLYGVALSEEDWAAIREENQNLAIEWGGEEAFLKRIWEEKGFKSLDLYEYMKSFNRLSELLLNEIYGEELELVSDEDVAEFIANDGFIMAKHIYLIKPDYGGSEDALEKIEGILAELEAYSGEGFDAYFDELMNTYSEDYEGLTNLPFGYLFQSGDLTQYFYDAAAMLDINELSGIVEGEEGYHIIYRIPINYDAMPFANILAEDNRTLRMLVAYAKFDLLLNDWVDALDPKYSEELETIDISEMFKRA